MLFVFYLWIYIDLTSGWIQWFSIKAKVKIKQQKQNSEFIYQSSERIILSFKLKNWKNCKVCIVDGVHGLTMLWNRTPVFSVLLSYWKCLKRDKFTW